MSWFSEEDKKVLDADEEMYAVWNDIFDRIFNKAVERALALMPSALGGLFKYAVNVENIQKQYAEKNPDLMEHKERLKELIGITSSEHPDWGIDKVVEESGKDLRKELKIVSSIGTIDLDSIERPSEEKLNGTKLKDS